MDHSKRKKFISRIAGNPPVVKKYLSEEEIPRYVFFLDAFPVNESGKILKRDLRPVNFER